MEKFQQDGSTAGIVIGSIAVIVILCGIGAFIYDQSNQRRERNVEPAAAPLLPVGAQIATTFNANEYYRPYVRSNAAPGP